MMHTERFNQLVQKYHQNILSESERSELFDFLQNDKNGEFVNAFWNKDFVSPSSPPKIDQSLLFNKILEDERLVYSTKESKIKRLKLYSRAIAASIIFIFISISILWTYQSYFSSKEESLSAQKEIIVPGGKLARMQFADGSYVAFEEIKRDTVLQDKGMRINVSPDGNVSYELINKEKSLNYTTVYTPRGGEYTLALADGSRVWLNSESKIKYPLEFDAESREVEIEGEVYFDIVPKFIGKKRVPFRVKTKSQMIEVLGTEFNVNAYQQYIYTTLVEGSVTVGNNTNDKNLLLTSNQQSVFNSANGMMEKSDVDPYYYVAWKNGKFAFRSATIQQVMEDLARWYDVDVIYQGDFRHITYSGSISRLESFEEVLKLIELTNKFKFKIDGRRVTVIKS